MSSSGLSSSGLSSSEPRDAPLSPSSWSPSPLKRLLRHRGAYWTVAAALALLAGIGVHRQTAEARDLVDRLGETADVVMTTVDLAPGDPLADSVEAVAVPVGLVPVGAMATVPEGATAGRHIPKGGLVTDLDLGATIAPGPNQAAIAVPASASTPPTFLGDAVLLVVAGDPFTGTVSRLIDGRVLGISDDRLVVAVARSDLADVAAALQVGGLSVAVA